MTLGTAALLPALRRPVQAAQTIASIDLLSGGDRLVLAVGAGFPGRSEPEFAVSDVRWRTRFFPAGRHRTALAAAVVRCRPPGFCRQSPAF
ncbi:LLM class flavin-dependent oxidoreductase [Fodinicola feengrottensis]|uniref:LLM class flavin-dependent oxidoreductase n=1 Tax=Fodinicola feengrottensis TaxID=435914 RepID=UPI0024422CBE|nr:LLM class flavin-dependent oxidoreductase [Fodinicola feengrottensis]